MKDKQIIGYSDENTVLLDYDDAARTAAIRETRALCARFKMRGWLLMASGNRSHYHAIFDRAVPYRTVCRIIDASSCWSQQSVYLRKRKGFTTLRITPIHSRNRERPAPRYIAHEGELKDRVLEYAAAYDAVNYKKKERWLGLIAFLKGD